MQSALSISAEGTLAFSRVAHPGRESDWLFSIGTLREVIVCAWIALIGRQIRELTRKKVGLSGIQQRSLLQDNYWPSFKLRYAQAFFLAIFVYKYKRHLKSIRLIISVRVELSTYFTHKTDPLTRFLLRLETIRNGRNRKQKVEFKVSS